MLGGVSRKDVAHFQLKVMMGSQYDRVVRSKTEKDIIIACLRMAWNDAFRHVSANRYKGTDDSQDGNRNTVLGIYGGTVTEARGKANKELGLNENNTDDGLIVSEYICQKILANPIVFKTFLKYVQKTNTEEKARVIVDAIENRKIRACFSNVKAIDDEEYPLCFGHFQKLFNMALKLYLCIYAIRVDIGLKTPMGNQISEQAFDHADCPIDSVILKILDKEENKEFFDVTEIKPHVKTKKTKKETSTVSFSKFEEIKWSKLGKFDVIAKKEGSDELSFEIAHYILIQNMIKEYVKKKHPGKSNLYFDFENWN